VPCARPPASASACSSTFVLLILAPALLYLRLYIAIFDMRAAARCHAAAFHRCGFHAMITTTASLPDTFFRYASRLTPPCALPTLRWHDKSFTPPRRCRAKIRAATSYRRGSRRRCRRRLPFFRYVITPRRLLPPRCRRVIASATPSADADVTPPHAIATRRRGAEGDAVSDMMSADAAFACFSRYAFAAYAPLMLPLSLSCPLRACA